MKPATRKGVKVDESLSDLDERALNFIRILERHTKYVIACGYVSMMFGKPRVTKGTDVFIKRLGKDDFTRLHEDLTWHGYACLNATDVDEMHTKLEDGLTVRFAFKDEAIPNFEVKFAKEKLVEEVILNAISVEKNSVYVRVSTLD